MGKMKVPTALSFISFILVFLSVYNGLTEAAGRSPRVKRNVFQLADIVHTYTGSPLKFLRYGCYCGMGGQAQPLDELDRSCRVIMKWALFVCCLVVLKDTTETRSFHEKRNLAQLDELIRYHTEWWSSLYVSDYGCYCGLGGTGMPVDQLDSCCKVHDDCYHKAAASTDCAAQSVYHIYYFFTDWTSCDYEPGYDCQFEVCQCDMDFAKCVGLHKEVYNRNKYWNIDKTLCV